MGLVVNVLCRNAEDDRVIPRFSRYLRDYLGWTLTTRPIDEADVYYLSGYFEWNVMRQALPKGKPVAAYFTHREEEPPGNAKAALFDRLAAQLDLRVATAGMYAGLLALSGATVQVPAPVERGRFTLSPALSPRESKLVVAGFSGYTYGNGRKGERLAEKLIDLGWEHVVWKASGRGWPVPTRRYGWAEMAGFYQSLDILVVVATVEGVPMPPLEALACGVSVVVPMGVGLLDELPDTPGIHRYKCGDVGDLVRAFRQAVTMRPQVDREALRAVTEPYTVTAWCETHRAVFDEVFG